MRKLQTVVSGLLTVAIVSTVTLAESGVHARNSVKTQNTTLVKPARFDEFFDFAGAEIKNGKIRFTKSGVSAELLLPPNSQVSFSSKSGELSPLRPDAGDDREKSGVRLKNQVVFTVHRAGKQLFKIEADEASFVVLQKT